MVYKGWVFFNMANRSASASATKAVLIMVCSWNYDFYTANRYGSGRWHDTDFYCLRNRS